MPENETSSINTSDLMQEIRRQISRQKSMYLAARYKERFFSELAASSDRFSQYRLDQSDGIWNIDEYEDLLGQIQSSNTARLEWPLRLNRFPFSLIGKRLKSLVLRALNALSHDQRQTVDQIVAFNGILIRHLCSVQQQMDQLNELSDKFKAAEERMLKKESYFFETLNGLRHSMDAFIEECRKCLPKQSLTSEQTQRIRRMRNTLLEPFYTEFTDTFRGSREEIKERLGVYLPYVSNCAVDWEQHGILDLGCGRGEWVELLTEHGYAVKGVDTSEQFVALCKARELQAELYDAIEYLQQVSQSSVGAITAFHLIEHFELDQLMAFFDRAYRALVPGGILIVETPNPQNLLVGSCNFWFDPTHVRPLPPKLIEFLSAHIGFDGISLLPMHPADKSEKIDDGTAAAQRINQYFYGDQDYAIFAYKRQDSGHEF